MLLVERTLEGRKLVMQMYLTAQSEDYTYNNLGPLLTRTLYRDVGGDFFKH